MSYIFWTSTEKRMEGRLTSFFNWLCTFSSFRHCRIEIRNMRLYKPGYYLKTSYFYFVIRTKDILLYKSSFPRRSLAIHSLLEGRKLSQSWISCLNQVTLRLTNHGKNHAYHKTGHRAWAGKTYKNKAVNRMCFSLFLASSCCFVDGYPAWQGFGKLDVRKQIQEIITYLS